MKLTQYELHERMTLLFGRKWQVQLAQLIKMNVSTVNRWATGKSEIPDWVDVLSWALLQLKVKGVEVPDEFLQGSQKPVQGDQD